MSDKREPRPQQVLQAYMDDLLAGPEDASPSEFADPLEEQRERLQKLLYSASALASPEAASIADPVVVDPKPTRSETAIEVKPSPPQTHTMVESAQDAFARAEREAEAELAQEARDAEAQARSEAELQDEELQSDDVQDGERQDEALALKDVEWLENGLPAWAQKRFDVLLFKVSGLTLAVPLIALGQIQPLTDDLTPLFGQADWFMGLLPTPTGKVRTVNTAKFVMPERYDENFVRTAQYVISIDGVPWGLAVDSVNQPISLNPEDVKWRSERSRRPWLAGTVKEHMCALLDIPRIGQLLTEADRRRA